MIDSKINNGWCTISTVEVEIESPDFEENIHTALDIAQGAPTPPLQRLEIMDEDSWEDLTLELTAYWKTQYSRVVRCGGGGDKGRDVIAYNPNGCWENFQCKHYKNALTLNDVVLEIGKSLYYAWAGEFTIPNKYYFVSPKGISTQLLTHLQDSNKLKQAVIARWEKQCQKKITTTQEIELRGDLLSFINNNIDFEMFDFIPPLEIIRRHSQTPFHAIRFGAIGVKRPKPLTPPNLPTTTELTYTTALLAAFSDAEKEKVNTKNLTGYLNYANEFNSARRNFYSADSLAKFSRDWLPADSYEDLLEECHETISPVVLSDHKSGFERYLQVSIQAATTDYSSHPLHNFIKIQDKKGFCHHLANLNKVKWVK
jgi:hypothetical protein